MQFSTDVSKCESRTIVHTELFLALGSFFYVWPFCTFPVHLSPICLHLGVFSLKDVESVLIGLKEFDLIHISLRRRRIVKEVWFVRIWMKQYETHYIREAISLN